MKRVPDGRIRTLPALATLGLLLVSALAWIVLESRGAEPTTSAEHPVFMLLADSHAAQERLPSIPNVQAVNDLDDIRAGTPELRAMIIIDGETGATMGPGDLRDFVANGSAVVGLNVPSQRLAELTGFIQELEKINPEFAKHRPLDKVPDDDFISIVWKSPPELNPGYWGRAQMRLDDPLTALVIEDYRMRVNGFLKGAEGELIPIEDYNRAQ
jgi:hypothetical protein